MPVPESRRIKMTASACVQKMLAARGRRIFYLGSALKSRGTLKGELDSGRMLIVAGESRRYDLRLSEHFSLKKSRRVFVIIDRAHNSMALSATEMSLVTHTLQLTAGGAPRTTIEAGCSYPFALSVKFPFIRPARNLYLAVSPLGYLINWIAHITLS